VLGVALTSGACPAPEEDAAWSVVFEGADLDRVVLSAWGQSIDDLYAVGGGLGNGRGGLVLHYDGAVWTELATGSTETFWWTWQSGPDDVTFVGEGGALFHYDGQSVEDRSGTTPLSLYGVWGAAADDVWAVGGDPLSDPPAGVILHYDGAAWTDATPAAGVPGTLFKVWGSGATNVYAVGQFGIILRYDGTDWTSESCATDVTLFTVAGRGADDVYAVGGAPARICHRDAAGWSRVDAGFPASIFNGVTVAPSGEAWVVGLGGVKLYRDGAGAWHDHTLAQPAWDLHAVWADADSEVLAVGGNFYAPPSPGISRIGVVGHYGIDPPTDVLTLQ
jgi:hypothetical protein